MKYSLIITILFSFIFCINNTYATEYKTQSEINFEYEVPIVALSIGIWASGEIFKNNLTSNKCRWCSKNTTDEKIRSNLKWTNPQKAAMLSNYTLLSIPILSLSPVFISDYINEKQNYLKSWGESGFIVLEAMSISMAVNQIVKFIAQRERPYVRDLSQNEETSDQWLSFYSGHTASAFAIASASAMLYTQKNGQYDVPLWILGGMAAGLTGYLRIAGDKHYFSDVLTGAVIGTIIGITTVKLHKYKNNQDTKTTKTFSLLPSSNSIFINFTMIF